jgi:hypothetical protein
MICPVVQDDRSELNIAAGQCRSYLFDCGGRHLGIPKVQTAQSRHLLEVWYRCICDGRPVDAEHFQVRQS